MEVREREVMADPVSSPTPGNTAQPMSPLTPPRPVSSVVPPVSPGLQPKVAVPVVNKPLAPMTPSKTPSITVQEQIVKPASPQLAQQPPKLVTPVTAMPRPPIPPPMPFKPLTPAPLTPTLPPLPASQPVQPIGKPMGQPAMPMQTKPIMPPMPQPPTAGAAPLRPPIGTPMPPTQPYQPPKNIPTATAPFKMTAGGAVPPPPTLQQPTKEQPTVMRQAKPADIKQSPFRFLPIVLGLLALLGLVWFAATKFFGLGQTTTPTTTGTRTATSPAPVKQTTITYWGLWEPSPVMDQIIKDFQTQNPGTVVNYVQQSPKEYRERLQDALKRGQGPDIFRYHATWASMLRSDLSTLPPSVMSQQEYEQTFYPIAATQLKTTSGFVGIPLMYDGLGLYYNTQIFQTANLTPPTQWADLESSAKTLTVRSKSGAIDRAGVALGTTGNVDNFSDILALLIFQNGGDPSKPSSPLVQQSVQYYTNFAKSLRVWDDTLPSSTYAFATEKSAMMLAPSWRAFEVKTLNPALQFAIAPVPQLPGTSVTWASYWVEGVSKTSKNQDLSWKFLKYLSQKDTLQKLHDAAVQKHPRLFGEIYPRKDMASLLSTDPYAAAYLSDAPKATSWWMASRTFDNGFNDKIVKYYEDAINAVNAGQVTAAEALTTTELGVTQVLQQAAQ